MQEFAPRQIRSLSRVRIELKRRKVRIVGPQIPAEFFVTSF